jgi:hypothetical protein
LASGAKREEDHSGHDHAAEQNAGSDDHEDHDDHGSEKVSQSESGLREGTAYLGRFRVR